MKRERVCPVRVGTGSWKRAHDDPWVSSDPTLILYHRTRVTGLTGEGLKGTEGLVQNRVYSGAYVLVGTGDTDRGQSG